MNVLLLGSGGREHALVWKLAQSPMCDKLFIAPGNPGTGNLGKNIELNLSDHNEIINFCQQQKINMLVVGPEKPLVDGIIDIFRRSCPDILTIGPTSYAAQLEGSKSFAKKFMQRHHIPTAGYLEVNLSNYEDGCRFLDAMSSPFVLKADGLASGKGVLIVEDRNDAKKQLLQMLNGKFGHASKTVVIETFLEGIEFSVFILTDGKNYVLLPEAKDYKRVGEGDTGLNTGGMGAVSPVSFVDKMMWEKVVSKIIEPTVKGFEIEKLDYKGFVFFGLINVNGEPFVIEYNCRLGDPETEAIVPRIKSDLLPLLEATSSGRLSDFNIEVSPEVATTIMLVSGGYPEDFGINFPISGLEKIKDSYVFQAGTGIENNQLVTKGGRVIAITSLQNTYEESISITLKNAQTVNFKQKYFRSDIGFDLINKS